MNCDTKNAAIRELTQQELENVSGGTSVVSAVAGAVKEVAKEAVKILSTGTFDTNLTPNQGVSAGAPG